MPDEGGSLGEGQEPSSTHSVGGRETPALAGQTFIMGEGHVTRGKRVGKGAVPIPPLPSPPRPRPGKSEWQGSLLTVTVGVSQEGTVCVVGKQNSCS